MMKTPTAAPIPTAGAPARTDRHPAPWRGPWPGLRIALVALALGGAAHAAGTEAAADAVSTDAVSTDAAGDVAAMDAVADAGAGTECAVTDDYPTTVVADYVLGCMAANGNTHEALQQCSCSIDFIRERMDYKAYEQAATVMQVQRDVGQRGIFYRDSNWAKGRVDRLEALQAESTLRCF